MKYTKALTSPAPQMGKRTVYQNLVDMGREGRALGFTLGKIMADANCLEQWERDAIAEGYGA